MTRDKFNKEKKINFYVFVWDLDMIKTKHMKRHDKKILHNMKRKHYSQSMKMLLV